MSEFEVVFPLESSKYGECVVLQKYGDMYKLIAGKINKEKIGTAFIRWVFPQGQDRKPMEKAIPLQINLGNLKEARDILQSILDALPGSPTKQDDIPF